MADDPRPDQIEGIATDPGASPGDPERRSNTLAPDLSDPGTDDDEQPGAEVGPTNAEVDDHPNVTGSDLTKGEPPHNPI